MRVAIALLAALSVLTACTPERHAAAPACTVGTRYGGFAPDAGFLTLPGSTLDAELAQMRSAGAAWVRLGAVWSQIEAVPGHDEWAATDRVVDAARAHGLRVLLLLTYAPQWARPSGTDDHGGPVTPAATRAFGDFAGRAAARYGPRGVDAYEVWNEPNVGAFWAPAPNPAAYARLLQAAFTAVHARQPKATVISGGLAPAGDDASSVSPLTFTTDLYRDGAGDAFDALGVHPYSFPTLPLAADTLSFNAFQRSALLHDVLSAHGQEAKQLWFTEFGAPTGSAPDAVTPDDQATAFTQAFGQLEQWTWAGPLFVYELRDAGNDAAAREDNFGVRTAGDRPKAAWARLQAIFATALGPACSGMQPVEHP